MNRLSLPSANVYSKLSYTLLIAVVFLLPLTEGEVINGSGISTLAGLAMVAAWLIGKAYTPGLRISRSSYILVALIAVQALSFFWSYEQDVTLTKLTLMAKNLILYFVIVDIIRDSKKLEILILSQTAGVIISSLSLIRNIFSMSVYSGASGRYSAEGFDPNNFGIMLASTVPVTIYASRRYPVLGLVALSLISGMIIATGSRSALISLAIGMSYILLSATSSLKNFVTYAVSLSIATFVFLRYFYDVIPKESIERIVNSLSEDVSNGRFDILKSSIAHIDQKVFLGWGSGTFPYVVGENAHNSFFSSTLEIGLFGLLIWITMWAYHIFCAFSIFRLSGKQSIEVVSAVSLFCISVSNFTLNWESRTLTYISLGIVAASYLNLLNSRKVERE